MCFFLGINSATAVTCYSTTRSPFSLMSEPLHIALERLDPVGKNRAVPIREDMILGIPPVAKLYVGRSSCAHCLRSCWFSLWPWYWCTGSEPRVRLEVAIDCEVPLSEREHGFPALSSLAVIGIKELSKWLKSLALEEYRFEKCFLGSPHC